MLTFSSEIKDLTTALAKAQGELENATKNAANPHFRSKYADLAEVLNVVRPVLAKHGMAITQHPAFAENTVHVTTLLSHSSGQWLQSCVSSPVGKPDAQGVGSAITYCRRYSLAAICGIAQEDDDGNAAVAKTPPPSNFKPDAKIVKKFTEAQTMDDLKTVWESIDVGIRHEYKEAKDAAKERIANA